MSNDNLAKGHRDRVRAKFMKLQSFESYEPYEILELLLFYAIPRKDTKSIAKNLISTFGSLKNIFEADINALKKQPGVGVSTAIFLHSFSQLHSYITHETAEKIRGSGDMGAYAINLTKGNIVEEFYAVALNTKNEILNCKKLATGKLSSVSVDVSDVVNFAFVNNSENIVLIHNHTNGSASPSHNDIDITEHFSNVSRHLGIKITDHIIAAGDKYFSFADNGLLNEKGVRR